MKDGFRVYDTDTHIDPGADVLEKYVDPGFRERLDELAPYRVAIKSRSVDGGVRNTYRFEQQALRAHPGRGRSRGRARPTAGYGAASGGLAPASSTTAPTTASSTWMTRDRTCIFWCRACGPASSGVPDVSLETGLIRAYHRHMHEFCGPYPGPAQGADRRLDPRCRRGGAEIRAWGNSKWAVAVQPLLDNDRRSTTPTSNRSGAPPRSTTWRSPITALPGRRPISPATQTCGTTSTWRGCARTRGGRCGSWPGFSPAASSTVIRACGSASSNAGSAGCRFGSAGWTSRSAMSAAPPN